MNNFLNQTINNITIQREATLNDNLNEAELQNDYVVNGELPETNSKLINEIEIEYLERGYDIQYLIDNFSAILSVAQQCPYAGGNAVIRARVWISMINDSIEYNDNAVCLQSGIYRLGVDITSEKINDEIIIQPNPAGDYITVITKSISSENCKIEIINNLNQVVLAKQLTCNNQEKIDVSKINQGLYAVKIILNNGITKIQKLIIAR
ncbi:MAG: T9SS type A sorting domain-containing protein [Bacteroidia bacterium]|nr:T9SS type A sorting domain-containing protein [Bacteroidia bacterium]